MKRFYSILFFSILIGCNEVSIDKNSEKPNTQANQIGFDIRCHIDSVGILHNEYLGLMYFKIKNIIGCIDSIPKMSFPSYATKFGVEYFFK